jgi:hypothetical protein
MALREWTLWRGNVFKGIKYLFSPPEAPIHVVHITESSYIAQDLCPVKGGWVDKITDRVKLTWLLVHSLKMKVYKEDELAQDQEVILVTSRSYVPIDPFNTLGKHRDQLTSLSQIGGIHHDEVMFDTGKKGQGQTLQQSIINYGFLFLTFMACVWFIKGAFIK